MAVKLFVIRCCFWCNSSRDINDPEHPLTLEQLNVIQEELITVDQNDNETIIDVITFLHVFFNNSLITEMCIPIRLSTVSTDSVLSRSDMYLQYHTVQWQHLLV